MEVVFWSTGCPRCKILASKLDSAGIEYVLNDDVDEMIKMGVKSAPQLSVDGELMDFGKAVKFINAIVKAEEEAKVGDAEADREKEGADR